MAGGIQFTTTDGSTYFVRDEVLSACKLEGEELEAAQKDLSSEHEQAITDSQQHSPEGDLPPLDFSAVGGETDEAAVRSTIMCCW